MIIFEDQLARIVEVLPTVTVGSATASVKFGWGTETVLANQLTLGGRNSFPLIWLVEGVDTNDLREPSVSRNARIVILHESQAPAEFNPYQHEYDYKLILQPILDNLLTILNTSQISRINQKEIKIQRVKNYSMVNFKNTINNEPSTGQSLVFICNAIVIDLPITFFNTQCETVLIN